MRLDPTTVTAGRRGLLTVEVANEGNTRLTGRLHGIDPEAQVVYDFVGGR